MSCISPKHDLHKLSSLLPKTQGKTGDTIDCHTPSSDSQQKGSNPPALTTTSPSNQSFPSRTPVRHRRCPDVTTPHRTEEEDGGQEEEEGGAGEEEEEEEERTEPKNCQQQPPAITGPRRTLPQATRRAAPR